MSRPPNLAAELHARSPLPITLRVRGRGTRLEQSLTTVERRAVMGAAVEALRNVQRHSGCDEAEVTMRRRRSSLRIDIRDRGVGLGDASVAGFGIDVSIVGRMREVGGDASVVELDRGTRVRLVWPAGRASPSLADSYERTVAASDPRAFLAIAVPFLIAHGYVAVNYISASERPAAAAFTGIAAVLTCLGTCRRLMRRAPTARWLCAVVATQLTLLAVGLWAAGPGALGDLRSWIVGASTVTLMLCAFVVPVRWLVALIAAPLGAVGVAVAFDPTLSAAESVGAFNAGFIATLCGGFIGNRLRRAEDDLRAQRRRGSAAVSDNERRHQVIAARRRYLAFTRTAIVPWLAQVADGAIDTAAPEVREQARQLSTAVRDDLFAAGFLDDDLRDAVRHFRVRGGLVELRAGLRASDRSPGTRVVLMELLTTLTAGHRVTITPSGASHGQVRIAVVPPVPPEVVERLRMPVDGDEYMSVLISPERVMVEEPASR